MKVSKEILTLVPYKPGKPINETKREYGIKQVYKLASNENPLGMSPKVLEALQNALANLHRYPDPACYDLIQLLSQEWKVPTSHISIGNGSNEIIDILIRIYCDSSEGILTSQSAFIAYKVCAQAARVKTFMVPLKTDLTFDLDTMANFIEHHPDSHIKLIFIANPNNPTGTYCNQFEVESFLKRVGNRDDVLIIFDEAYTEFVRAKDYKSAIDYMNQYNNIAVIKTFSKVYGLAGLRIGAMIAQPTVTDLFNRVRNPFNVNELAQVAAIAALQDKEYIRASQELVWSGLDYFYAELKKMGLPFVESQGNFVLFDTLRDVAQVNEGLLRRGVIMRPVQAYGFSTHLRLSVGTEEENVIAMKSLREVIAEIKTLK